MLFGLQIRYLQQLPEGWTFQQGAAFLVQGLTAMYGLRSQGNLRRRQTVLIHSAAGGCGQFAMAICHAFGATPIATVGSVSKVDYLLGRFPWLKREQIIVRDGFRQAPAGIKMVPKYLCVIPKAVQGTSVCTDIYALILIRSYKFCNCTCSVAAG